MVLRAVAVLFALAAAAVGFLLVPPHLQIRSIAPALPATADLRALAARDDGPVAIGYVNTSTQPMATGLLGHTVVFVEWADGRLFMIDAAMDRDGAAEFAELMQLLGDADAAVVHGSIAELAPAAVGRVAGVGFTHLHIDHTQGVGAFCAARAVGAPAPVVYQSCLLYTSPSPRDRTRSRMPSSA